MVRRSPDHGAPELVFDAVCRALHRAYGDQHWWPAESPFEVICGAILIQRTAWRNAELALAALRERRLFVPARLAAQTSTALEPLVRPAGFYRQKAARLVRVARWVRARGGVAALAQLETAPLRRELLAVDGIGPETADAIVLYAFGRPVFVVDAYARRLFSRLGIGGAREPYEALRSRVERALPADAALLNEYHALIVAHGQARCAARPRCAGCPLQPQCPAATTRD